ncbi:MAG: hypothetical protein HC799_17475 [Limnothrix sp. RL_2_0]|nr:hypothetical protein [Limnothrix sp. RL_2_0]
MSEEPRGNVWEIDKNSFVPIVKRPTEPAPKVTEQKELSPIWSIAVLGMAAIASTVIFFYLGSLLLQDWNQQREVSARQELARIKSCLN